MFTKSFCMSGRLIRRWKMSSTNAPYATLHDLPKYEKRADVVGAPWFKDQETVKCSRGHDPIPYITCNSRTAPFATFHNIPETSEVTTFTIFMVFKDFCFSNTTFETESIHSHLQLRVLLFIRILSHRLSFLLFFHDIL